MAAPSVMNARNDPGKAVMEKHRQADTLSSLQSLLVTVVIAVFVITFIVQAFQIPSESMETTLLIGDYLLVDKFRYGGGGSGICSCPTGECSGETSSSSAIRFTRPSIL